MSLEHLAMLGIRKGKVRPVNPESNPNGTPPKAIPGQKLSQALKQHHQLAFGHLQKKQNKGCPFSNKTKIPVAHLRDVIRREVCRVGFELRNPKPETRNRLWRLTFPRTDRNPKPETRNPKPETDSEDLYLPQDRSKPETRNPKPETDSEDLPSPGPVETRNPKPETRNRLWRLTFPRTDRNPKPETRNPKPTLKTYLPQDRSKPETRNPKPETDSEDLTSPGPIEFNFPRTDRNPKPEARNRLWRLNFPRTDGNPKPETDSEDLTSPGPIETRNPKPETRNRLWRLNFPMQDRSKPETRNPKPETDSESWFQATKPETRNPKPTAKVGFNRRNPKPETRNPKPTRIRLLGGSPDRNSTLAVEWKAFTESLQTLNHVPGYILLC